MRYFKKERTTREITHKELLRKSFTSWKAKEKIMKGQDIYNPTKHKKDESSNGRIYGTNSLCY